MPEFSVTATYTVHAKIHAEARANCLQGTLDSTHATLIFDDVEATYKTVTVRFHDLGEGLEGDYDQDDEDDEPRLRFDANLIGKSNGEGPAGHDESWSTNINPLTVDRAKLQGLAQEMAKAFHALGKAGWKRCAERFAATTTDQVNARSTA